MSLSRLQDTRSTYKSQSYIYPLVTITFWNLKKKNNYHNGIKMWNRINPTKNVKYLQIENYKTLPREIKEDKYIERWIMFIHGKN